MLKNKYIILALIIGLALGLYYLLNVGKSNLLGELKETDALEEGSQVVDTVMSIQEVKDKYESELLSINGLNGVAIGKCGEELCIKIYLEKETNATKKIPSQIEGYHVEKELRSTFHPL